MKKTVLSCLLIAVGFVMGCGGGGDASTAATPAASAVVIGGTPVNNAPPATTTKTGTPVISNLTLNPNTAKAGDRITFSLAFTDANADVNTFGIQFNGENKYYAYDVSGVASGNMAFNLTVQDTIGNVSAGAYQVTVFLIDKLGNVSNYLTATLTVQGSSPPTPTTDISGYWAAHFTSPDSPTEEVYLQFTQNGGSVTLSDPCTVGKSSLNGTANGANFSITSEGFNMTGTVNGNSITGSFSNEWGAGTWTATKMSSAPTSGQCIRSGVEVILVRFQPGTKYCIEAFITDPNHSVTSASLVGMGNSQGFTYDSVKKRWVDSGTRYCTSSPSFPMSYTVTVNLNDATSFIVSKSVISWEWAE